MAHERPVDALLRWASDMQLAMRGVIGVLGDIPLVDADWDPEEYLETARAWHANAIKNIAHTRKLMGSPPPGDHDATVMRSIRAGYAGASSMLDYGTELARLVLKIIESMEANTKPETDVLLDLLLDYPVLLLESRARQLLDAAASMHPDDANGRLMAVNGLAHLIVVEIQRADVAAERKQFVDLVALGGKLDRYVHEYSEALVIAERQMKRFEQSIPEQPEEDRPLLTQFIPSYFEDIAAFRLLQESLAALPSMAKSSRTISGFAKKAQPVWKAFRGVEDANDRRALLRAQRVQNP